MSSIGDFLNALFSGSPTMEQAPIPLNPIGNDVSWSPGWQLPEGFGVRRPPVGALQSLIEKPGQSILEQILRYAPKIETGGSPTQQAEQMQIQTGGLSPMEVQSPGFPSGRVLQQRPVDTALPPVPGALALGAEATRGALALPGTQDEAIRQFLRERKMAVQSGSEGLSLRTPRGRKLLKARRPTR